MHTTTPARHPDAAPPIITALAVTALAAACITLGPLIYRALQIAGTGILALAVVIITARAGVSLLRDLLADDE